MRKPVVLAVDDDREVLSAVFRDLRARYGARYQIVKAQSGAEALQTARELKQRGTPVALFIVDERMPAMSGTQFLLQALGMFPDTRRVLLTAYADTETAIAGINETRLDHYLFKPWDPPEERLYPVLDRLLEEWAAHARPTFDGIRVAGSALSARTHATKQFLSSNHIPYGALDVDHDPATRALIESAGLSLERLPIVFLQDGTALVQPDARELAEKVGLHTQANLKFYDLIIVGGGPAGLAAAVYGASEGLVTLLVERDAPGGQAGTSSRIENYLGFPDGVSGEDLARRAERQAERLRAEILRAQEVVEVRREDPYRVVRLADGAELKGYVVLIASGMEVRRLEVPGLDALLGAGVYYGAALAEAALYRDRDVIVVGGANSAGQGAMHCSRFARSVRIVLRADDLRKGMSQYLVDRISETGNVLVEPGTVVTGVRGQDRLEAVTLRNTTTGAEKEITVEAMFIFIGTAPHTGMVASLVARDAHGFILTGRDAMPGGQRPKGWTADRDPLPFETTVPGIFAAGDSRHGSSKRVAAAVGEGSAAVSMIHEYLRDV